MSTIIKKREQAFKIKDISNNDVIKGYTDYLNSINIKTDKDKYIQNKVFAKSSDLKVNDYKNKVIDIKKSLITENKKDILRTNNKSRIIEDSIIKDEKQDKQNKQEKPTQNTKSTDLKKEDIKEQKSINNEKLDKGKKQSNNRYSLSKRVLKGAEYTLDNILIDDEEDLGISTIIKTKAGAKGAVALNKKGININKKIGQKAFQVATSDNAKAIYAGVISTGKKAYKVAESTYNNVYISNKVKSTLRKSKENTLRQKQKKAILSKARKKVKEQAENVIRIVITKAKNVLVSLFTKKIAIVSLIIIALISVLISTVVGITSLFGFSINMSLDDDVTMIYEYISQLDTDINYQIDNVKNTYSADDYVFNVEHRAETNKEQVYAFIKAKYGDKKISEEVIKAEIEQIHNNLYKLTFVETTNSYTVENEDGTTTTHTSITLTTTLTTKSFSEYYEENKDTLLQKYQQKDFDNIKEMMKENAGKILNNPFPNTDWRNHVTSEYGYRIHPITKQFSKHTGIDIAMPQGTLIYACMSGTVETFNSGNTGYGLHLRITNGKYQTLYAHCSELLVQSGDIVNAGDVVAKIGSTGDSTGPHLHLEYLVNGIRKNPRAYLKVYKGGT